MTPIVCPRCGATMNRHAEKVVAPSGVADATGLNPAPGGVVLEAHECPGCGATATRLIGAAAPAR